MPIEIIEVKNRSDLKRFIYLPAEIHKNHKNWVPPIYLDEFDYFNPQKNKSFDNSDTILLLALRNNIPVGRIMGILNRKYNKLYNENNARFCFMETYDDQEVFHLLINAVEQWAKSKGCEKIIGPLGFSDKDPEGFLIEGFDKPIVISTNGNLPHMPALLEKEGFTKEIDCVVYNVPVPKEIPAFYQAIFKRAMNGKDFEIVEFKTRRQLKPFIRPILTLLNETFEGIYAFVPFEDYQMDEYANRYIYLLDPEFIKVVLNSQKEPIAFIIGMPDISQGIIKAKGKLLPFGFFKILASQKKTKQLNLLLGGIKTEYRGQGLDVILGKLFLESASKRGFEYLDSHLELETNTRIRNEMEKMGGFIYKKYRIFQKKLS